MFLSFFKKKSDKGTKGDGCMVPEIAREAQDCSEPNRKGNDEELKFAIFDLIKTIRDPEKPNTLEELNVIYEEGIFVKDSTSCSISVVRIEFNPTVPHCSLATLIGLCIRIKIERNFPSALKLDIYIKKGAHATEDEINKQINDKERIAAAMENPNLKKMVDSCIQDED